MSDTLYENYTINDGTLLSVFGMNWGAQSFTPSISHTITSVKFLLYRVGLPGTVTVSIRATSAGLPSGSDLASGTTDGDSLTTSIAGELREVTLGAGTLLIANTKYAIVLRAPSANGTTVLRYISDQTTVSYAGGADHYSSDSGVTWDSGGGSGRDDVFYEYGIPIPGEGQGLLAVVGETLHYVSKTGQEYVIQGTLV